MTTKNTAQSLSVELLSKRINLLEEIRVLEETLKSRNINLPLAKPETVEKLSTYDNFIKDKINILEERKKQLEALLPPQDQKMRKALLTAPVMPVMPKMPNVRMSRMIASNNQMLDLVKKKDKLQAEVEELRKQYPNVYLPQFKAFDGATIRDVIQNLEDKKTILTPPTPPTPPNNLMQDMTSPAPIGEEFLPEQNPKDLYLYKKLLVVRDNNGRQKVIEALYNDEYSVKDAADDTKYYANQMIKNYIGVWPPQMRWQPDSPDDIEDKKTTILETAAALATPPTPPQRHMTNPATMKVPDKFLPEQNPQDPYKNILDKADADKAAIKDAVEKAVKSDPKIDLKALSETLEDYKTKTPTLTDSLDIFAKVIISLIQTLKNPNTTENLNWRPWLIMRFLEALTHFKKRSVLTLLFNEIKEKYKMLNKDKDDESAVSIIEELKPWICDELYDYQKSIQEMSISKNLTLENIPDSNDYSHEFVRKKNDALIQTIQNLKQSKEKTLPKTTLDKLLKEIQAEINRIKCPKRGGKTLRRRQMKTTRTRTTVPREKGLRKRATIGQKKKQKKTRTRN
jgi:hypothetical protein